MNIKIDKRDNGSCRFLYEYENKNFSHQINYNHELEPTDDALFRIGLLARPSNSPVYKIEGVNVSQGAYISFKDMLRSRIEVEITDNSESSNEITRLPVKSVLCFSGGFDSIAAKALVSRRIDLFSIAFGGGFERESNFFNTFDSNIVSWELRGKRPGQKVKFAENIDWRFLLAPSLLLRGHNEKLGVLTGTIMEASPDIFTSENVPEFTCYRDVLGPSVVVTSPVSSLTEYATTLIANKYLGADQILHSLKSLASPTSVKYYRKKILLAIVNDDDLPRAGINVQKHRYGSNFADDFLSMYLAWKCGKKWALDNYVDKLPEGYGELDFSFVEKSNQRRLGVLDPDFRTEVTQGIKHYGIDFYNDFDFVQLDKTRSILLNKKDKAKNAVLQKQIDKPSLVSNLLSFFK